MTKREFEIERIRIIANLLGKPKANGNYPISEAFDEFDKLYDKLTVRKVFTCPHCDCLFSLR